MGKGPLVRVQLEPGRFVKMHRKDARRLGLLEPQKKRESAEDKMLRPEGNKVLSESRSAAQSVETTDDFTEIPGIGAYTAHELAEMGLRTFAQLREVDLNDLPWRARQAIREWRDE